MIKVLGKGVQIEGRLIRIAHIDGDMYNSPEDPEAMLHALRRCGTRIDIFTFLQKPPEAQPRYTYRMEWDNLAVLPVITFDHWWAHQIRSIVRNRARQAEKKGVVFREVTLGDSLAQGICEIYNECPTRRGKRFPHYGMSLGRSREYAGTSPIRSP